MVPSSSVVILNTHPILKSMRRENRTHIRKELGLHYADSLKMIIPVFDPQASVAAAVKALSATQTKYAWVGGADSSRVLDNGGVAIRDHPQNLQIDFVDRRYYLSRLYAIPIEEAADSSPRRYPLRFRAELADTHLGFASADRLDAMAIAAGRRKRFRLEKPPLGVESGRKSC
ncbi:MAG: hypothetical protein AAFN74_15805 [Myxococcota bacterium]